MKKLFSTILVMVSISGASGCGQLTRGGTASRQDSPTNRNSRIDRILPEDAEYSREQLATVIDAIRAVRPDIPPKELPLNGKAVRLVLQDMSVSDLDRVEAILPSIANKRKAQGASVD